MFWATGMNNKFRTNTAIFSEKISNAPLEFWLLLGLSVSFFVFQFMPMFFRYDTSMSQGFEYITPRDNMIGGDHFEIVNGMSRAFFNAEPRFVLKGPYPPFTVLFHLPFTLFDTRTSYILISLMTLAALVFLTLVLPTWLEPKQRSHPFLIALFLSGYFSYGFQFEVERGQFNLIALCFTLTSIWLFHRTPKMRWLAYLLFSAAVQLKVYPAIFILALVDDWQDWKGIAKRFIGLGLFNLAILFLFGFGNFLRFFGDLTKMAGADVSVSQNHSVGSFVALIADKLPFLAKYSGYLSTLALGFVLICLALIVFQSYRNRLTGIDPLIVLACAVVAQLIPRISFDYTLSILPAAMAFFLVGVEKSRKSVVAVLALLLICTAYGSTLFSSAYKFAAKELFPALTAFSNNSPALVMILVAVTILSFSLYPAALPHSKVETLIDETKN